MRGAREHWDPVWVVVDGSTDGTGEKLATMAAADPALRVLLRPKNCGKGAAVLYGLRAALARGYTHALVMDSAMILGEPVFDAGAPRLRVNGRKISNWWANVETLWMGIHDSLFGFRVYPIAPLVRAMRFQPWMRRFDFDVEAVVRLCWHGVLPINLPAKVEYFSAAEGGVSHFNYWRDNALLTWMHARLFAEFLLRLPVLLMHSSAAKIAR